MKEKTLDILLIEDSVEDVELTREALREGKIEGRLNVIDNGIDAMSYLRRELDPDTHVPDLIILDLNLPKKNGLEVLEEIQADKSLRDIPLVVLSTSQPSAELLNEFGIHPDRYVRKSPDFHLLIQCVQDIRSRVLQEGEGPAVDVSTTSQLNILLIEDNLADVELLQEILSMKEKNEWHLMHVSRLEEALRYMEERTVDAVVLDLFLPDSHGMETLHRIRQKKSQVPIIVLTGLKNEDVALEAVREGAQDFLVKGQITSNMFTRSVQYAIERQRLEMMKDELIGYVNHEINNPLTTIIEAIKQVVEGHLGETNQRQKLFLDAALSSMYRLRSIAEEILDRTKLEFGKLQLDKEAINIVEIADEILRTFQFLADQHGITIQGKFAAPEILIRADRGRIGQILMNLINNAIKFTRQGSIVVEIQESEEWVTCSVQDTGSGIPPEKLPHVFAKFERYDAHANTENKRNGLGLGLFICKELVELHKGKISIASTPGQGTTVTFQLPRIGEAE